MDLANARVTRTAVDLLAPRQGEHVLDAGCGTGAALAEVRRRAPCVLAGIDRSATMIAAARRRLGPEPWLRTVAVEASPPFVCPFDGVLLLNVLYFSGHDAAMVQALHRQLKPGGRLVAYVTHRETMERWAFARAGLHRLFDECDLAQVLIDGGFAPSRVAVQERPVTSTVRGLFAVAYK